MSKENYSTSIYNQLKRGVRNTLFYGLTTAVLSSPILPELTYAGPAKQSKETRARVDSSRNFSSVNDSTYNNIRGMGKSTVVINFKNGKGQYDPVTGQFFITTPSANIPIDVSKSLRVNVYERTRQKDWWGAAGKIREEIHLDNAYLRHDSTTGRYIVFEAPSPESKVQKTGLESRVDSLVTRLQKVEGRLNGKSVARKVAKPVKSQTYVQSPVQIPQKTTQPYEASKKTEYNQTQTQYQIPIKTPSEKPSILTKPNYLETIVSESAHKDSITVNQTRINNINERIHNEFHKSSKWPWIIGGAAVAAGIYLLVKDNKEKSDGSGSGVTGGETGGAGVR